MANNEARVEKNIEKVFQEMGLRIPTTVEGQPAIDHQHTRFNVTSPVDGQHLATLTEHSFEDIDEKIHQAQQAFYEWRKVPAPLRGELVRLYGQCLREHKSRLAQCITAECGKIISEAEGEVQEMIDICDFSVGLSRQLYGLTIASERPNHALRENWHPLGPVGIISAFNFPMAVWAWNATLALVCGNSLVWKPSEKTPLCALACQQLLEQVLAQYEHAPQGLSQLILGSQAAGEQLVDDTRIPLVSATGSCAMGKKVAPKLAARFAKSILELGGNNAIIVTPSADLEMATAAVVFGAVGTAGQRCTTTRRVFIHKDIYHDFFQGLKQAYEQLSIGDPLNANTHVGPLIDAAAFEQMQNALNKAQADGCQVFGGERVQENLGANAYYVKPALVDTTSNKKGNWINQTEETFAPILYAFEYDDLDEAILRQNQVPQGLSSAIFTLNMREAEQFVSAVGSDCGITNVNVGTSGAEIGGAFGGEKETGGGRESGSDAWKAYMRRATATINYSQELPLAQGIQFSLKD